jgi:hypothetical protein
MAFQLIKNDKNVKDLTNVGQFAIINNVAKQIGSVMSNAVYHSETIHGHIITFNLDEFHKPHNSAINYVDFKFLAKLEENKWVRYICVSVNGGLNIHLHR